MKTCSAHFEIAFAAGPRARAMAANGPRSRHRVLLDTESR